LPLLDVEVLPPVQPLEEPPPEEPPPEEQPPEEPPPEEPPPEEQQSHVPIATPTAQDGLPQDSVPTTFTTST